MRNKPICWPPHDGASSGMQAHLVMLHCAPEPAGISNAAACTPSQFRNRPIVEGCQSRVGRHADGAGRHGRELDGIFDIPENKEAAKRTGGVGGTISRLIAAYSS